MTGSYPEIILAICLLILPFLYETSHVFRYHLKFFLAYSIFIFNSVILLPVFCLRPRNVKNFLIASDFCRWISTLIGLRWIVRGKEHLEKDQACIIIANHQSSLDVLGLMDLWRYMVKCTVIAKQELLYSGPFGFAAYLCGIIYIPRVHTDKAKIIMNEAADKLKAEKGKVLAFYFSILIQKMGEYFSSIFATEEPIRQVSYDETSNVAVRMTVFRIKLWVFPEGTRRNNGKIHPFKKGAFHMAISKKIPIIPLVYSRYYFLDDNARRFDCGNIIITALPQIETKDYTMDNLEELMEEVRSVMIKTFNETSKEVVSDTISNSNVDVN